MSAWVAVETALRSWVVAGTGVPADRVFWTDQEFPRPATAPYVTLKITAERVRSTWTNARLADVPTAGAEVEHVARATVAATLTVQVIGGAGCGVARAGALLGDMLLKAALPSVRGSLRAARVGLGTIGAVRPIGGGVTPAFFEPRAVVEIGLHLTREAVETGTYIENATVTGTVG